MCGIAGIYLKDPSNSPFSAKEIEATVDWLFCGIENRGTHASGIAVQNVNGESYLEKSDMPASKFIFWRRDIPSDPRIILQHTRLATKGKPENLLNNHPVQYENIMATHNGHISNDDELFKDEEIKRIAEVDSEIIPALLHKYTFADPKAALEKMIGGFAIAAFDSENPGTLLLAKGSSSPLVWIETSDMFMWASEQKFLEEALLHGMGYESKSSEFNNLPYAKYALINGSEMELNDFEVAFKSYVSQPYSKAYNSRTTEHRNYSEGWYMDDGWNSSSRDQCDECFIWFPATVLNKFENQYYCDHCEAKLFEILSDGTRVKKEKKKLSRKERKRIRRQATRRFQENKRREEKESLSDEAQAISKILNKEHWDICQKVAQHYGTKASFVDFMLFGDQDVEDFDDPNLVSMFLEFQGKYEEFLEEVREETDSAMAGLKNEQTEQSKVFPVGF